MRTRAFTLVEIGLAFFLTSIVLALLVQVYGSTLHRYLSGEDTLTGARDAELILAHLRADISQAYGSPAGDITISPGTGATFPKRVLHLVQDPATDRIALIPFLLAETPYPLPGEHPLAAKLSLGPVIAPALVALSMAHNTFAWIEPDSPKDKDPRQFVLNTRNGAVTQRVTYTWTPADRTLRREGPDGAFDLGRDNLVGFHAFPVVELLIPESEPSRPPEVLKAWVEVHLELKAPQAPAEKIEKRTVQVDTRIVPRMLNGGMRGVWSL